MEIDIIIPLIIFLGSLIYATFGFGDALFAMPLLTMVIGIKTATPVMTLNGLTLATILFLKNYKNVDWKSVRKLFVSSALGIPIGIYFLKNGNEQLIKIFLGCVILGVAVYNLFIRKANQPAVITNTNWAYFFGFIAGILGGAFNTGGPPVVIYGTLSSWSPAQFVSTLQGYFLPVDLAILTGQAFSGLLTTTVFRYYLISLPFTLTALFLGKELRKKIPAHKFNGYIFILLFCIGLLFLIRTVLSA
jgi:uncharacterized protein